MERIRELNRYQRIILLILVVMTVVSAPIYALTTSRVGYLHNDAIFVPRQENGVTLYEATVDNQSCTFTVTDDTVTFTCGSKTYGPYTLREDPAAIPAGYTLAPYMTGIVILDGDETWFRGGLTEEIDDFWLVSQDGQHPLSITVTMGDGTELDMDGNPVDHMEPTPYQIVSLLRGPELTHKGYWPIWFLGMAFSIFTAVSILFADELFRLSLSFRVRDAYAVEPSDWHIASRNLSWFLLTIFTGAIYLMGLQA